MDNILPTELAARIRDPELKPYVGMFDWERHLKPEKLECLALYRQTQAENKAEGDDGKAFARAWTRVTMSPELSQDLAEAEGPEDRTLLLYEAEIHSYPFALIVWPLYKEEM